MIYGLQCWYFFVHTRISFHPERFHCFTLNLIWKIFIYFLLMLIHVKIKTLLRVIHLVTNKTFYDNWFLYWLRLIWKKRFFIICRRRLYFHYYRSFLFFSNSNLYFFYKKGKWDYYQIKANYYKKIEIYFIKECRKNIRKQTSMEKL